jgi:hypothetical protein
MEPNREPHRPTAASFDAAVSPSTPAQPLGESPPKRIGWLEGHLPDIVEPLVPTDPDNSFTQTRRLRHDGWTPEKKRLFLERFAETGIIVEACEAVGMSARSAYNLHGRDPLFAAGWDAACVKARRPLADDIMSRSRNGVIERIYKDGVVVAERHRYDNRLTMAALTRLDARIDRAEKMGSPHLKLVANWEEYLDALGEDRRDEAGALLAPPEPPPPAHLAALREDAGYRELHELHPADEAETDEDPHDVWEARGEWWTDYPPPAGFDGDEEGEYGNQGYRRTLTASEQAVIDAREARERAEALALAEAQRDAFFAANDDVEEEESDDPDEEEEEPGEIEGGDEAGDGSPPGLPRPAAHSAPPVPDDRGEPVENQDRPTNDSGAPPPPVVISGAHPT